MRSALVLLVFTAPEGTPEGLLSRGTSFGFRQLERCEGPKFDGRAMRNRQKRNEQTDWRSTMEEIGRELGKIIGNLNGCLGDYAQSSRN
jgi:hypothetical protein